MNNTDKSMESDKVLYYTPTPFPLMLSHVPCLYCLLGLLALKFIMPRGEKTQAICLVHTISTCCTLHRDAQCFHVLCVLVLSGGGKPHKSFHPMQNSISPIYQGTFTDKSFLFISRCFPNNESFILNPSAMKSGGMTMEPSSK